MFNYPVNYINITQNNHGTDYAIDLGWGKEYGGANVPIYSVFDGVVINTTTNKEGGKRVVTKHEIGEYVYYVKQVHFAKVLVSVNEEVTRDTIIGIMGKTGNATGNHDHISIFRCPKGIEFNYSTAFYNKYKVDPKEYLYVFPYQTISEKTREKYGNILRFVDSEIKSYKSSSDELNIRTGPGVNHEKIGVLKLNDIVKVYARSGKWVRIDEIEDKWVSSNYLVEFDEIDEKKNILKKLLEKIKVIINKILNILNI